MSRVKEADAAQMMPSNQYELAYLLARVNLPSLPEAVVKLNQSMSKDDTVLDEIEAIIKTEPAMAARVLQLANSAWYRSKDPVTNIRDAVSNIGFDAIHRLIIITSVIEIFQGVDTTLLNMGTYWKQSARMASAARILAEASGNEKGAMRVFTSGILGYIGKLVLAISIPNVEQKALLISKEEAIPLYRAEQQVIGHDHAEVGSQLLVNWFVPEDLTRPIRHLYEPEKAAADYRLDASTLNIAHHMQYTYWHDIALTDPPAEPSRYAMQMLGLGEDMLPALSREVDEDYRKTLVMLELS